MLQQGLEGVVRFASVVRASIVGVLVALPVGACGGGDSAPSSGGGSSTDTAFVKGLCQGFGAFSASIEKSFSGPTPSDIGSALAQLLKAMVEPTQKFSDSFQKLTPPSDISEWHKNAAAQLAAAAKALKDGKFDDPSLQGLSDSPIPDMPEPARDRLGAIAAKTDECKKANPFDTAAGSNSSSSSGAATPALKDAASGTWTGKFGTITFNSDGTAKFTIKNCGTESPSGAPFGAVDTCTPDTYTGKLRVGSNEYTLEDASGVGTSFQAYVDKDKKLHVGIGTVSDFGPGQKGTVQIFAGASMTVDGTKCSRQPFGGKGSTSVPCSWKKEQGKDVLEFDNDFGSKEELVILADEKLAVSPTIYVAVFDEKK